MLHVGDWTAFSGDNFFHLALHSVSESRVHTTTLVEAGGQLPVVIVFVDTDEHVNRVLPKLREMAAH